MQCKFKEKLIYAGDMIIGVVYGTFRMSGARRWSGSKNLVKPVEKVNENRYSKRELKEIADGGNPHRFFADRYGGYWLSEFPEVHKNSINGSYYMTFVMNKPDSDNLEKYARRKGKKRE